MEVNLTFRFLASGYSAVACVTHRPATDRQVLVNIVTADIAAVIYGGARMMII